MAEGREPTSDNEVVLDRVLANRHAFKIGDSFQAAGHELKVVGLSSDTSTFTGSYVFARKTLLESMVLAPGAATLVLVTPTSSTTPAELLARLGAVTGTNVLLKSQLMSNDQDVLAGVLDQVVYLMVAAAFIVGALVVGMVIYTATNERRGEYGILKAIGARNGTLYRVVASQAVIAASVGSVLGVGFAFAMGSVVMNFKPQFLVAIEPMQIAITLVAGLVMALAGALVPARGVAGVAPAEVFRR